MNVASLKSFVVAAREQSFSQAAERLHLTQSGLSRRISVLEDELGVKLFDRIGRRVFLTGPGKKLLSHADKIVMAADNAKADLNKNNAVVEGDLAISTTQHIAIYYLQPVFKQMVDEYPKIELGVEFLTSQTTHQKVINGELELAIMTEPTLPDPSVVYQKIAEERMVFAVSADHPLATREAPTLAALTEYRAILPGSKTYTRQRLDELFARLNLKPQVSSPSSYLEALRLLTASGMGWSVLAEPMIDDRLKRLPLFDHEICRPLVVAYHKERTLSKPACLLLEKLAQLNP